MRRESHQNSKNDILILKRSRTPWPKRPVGGWIAYFGRGCPVSPETRVQIRFSDGLEVESFASSWNWDRSPDNVLEITHYQVVEPKENGPRPKSSIELEGSLGEVQEVTGTHGALIDGKVVPAEGAKPFTYKVRQFIFAGEAERMDESDKP